MNDGVCFWLSVFNVSSHVTGEKEKALINEILDTINMLLALQLKEFLADYI
jgi:hypothetical protein